MNVNVEAVQDGLEESVRKGQTPVEATGEALWVADSDRQQGIVSRKTHDELLKVIDEWLATKMNVPLDELGPYRMIVAGYAQFLAERVSFDIKANPMATLDKARREWRERSGPS